MEWRFLVYIATALIVGFVVYSVSKSNGTDLLEIQGFKDNVVLDTSKQSMFPYTTTPIQNLDQYELEAVFDNEGDRELKKQQINQMTRRFPLDWVNYPPNASKFQSEQAKYIDGFTSKASAKNLEEPYRAMGDGNLKPPDTLEMERREREILTTYAPKKANELGTYDLDDAESLMQKIYKAKGLEPTVIRKEGNVFEVVSTRQIGGKVQYEDELPDAPVSNTSNMAAGEGVIHVPPVATQTAAGLDPFYEPTTATRSNRTDYMRWTPGLERMFAPTNPTSDWVGQSA